MKSMKKATRSSFLIGIAVMLAVLMFLPGVIPFVQPAVVEAKTVRTSITGAEVRGIRSKTWTGKRIKQDTMNPIRKMASQTLTKRLLVVMWGVPPFFLFPCRL